MIRNFLFSFFFFFGIIIISLVFLPSFFLPQKVVLVGGKLMGYWSAICLRIFLNVKIIIKGKENIISNQKFFIASSHQSMFETFFLQTIFNSPVFILKNELLLIPIFGWYLKKIGSISIKRNKITKDNLGFIDDIIKMTQTTNRPLIIFPQGTRALPDDRSDFKKGAGRINEQINVPCQPIAINSGYVWPKKKQMTPNKDITISILKKIDQGLSKEKFVELLQKEIYGELDKIN